MFSTIYQLVIVGWKKVTDSALIGQDLWKCHMVQIFNKEKYWQIGVEKQFDSSVIAIISKCMIVKISIWKKGIGIEGEKVIETS